MNVGQIELRQLEALVAVVDEGSFGRAAQSLGFTQSAISQQVAGLERAVGSKVLDRPRGPRRSELTPVGQVVLGHARAVLKQLELAADEVASIRAGTSGRLVIGTFQSASVKLLPDVVGRFKAELPELDVRLYESDDNLDLQQRLLTDELDVAFVVGPVANDRLETIEIVKDLFVVLLPAGEGGERDGVFPITDLAGRDMVGQQGGACQALVEQGMAEQGVIPHYVFRSNDNGAVQNMVKAGMGLAVMPMLAIDASDAGIRVLPLHPPIEPRSILLAIRSERTIAPAVRRFVDLAKEWCHT